MQCHDDCIKTRLACTSNMSAPDRARWAIKTGPFLKAHNYYCSMTPATDIVCQKVLVVVDFLLVLIERFSLCLWAEALRANID